MKEEAKDQQEAAVKNRRPLRQPLDHSMKTKHLDTLLFLFMILIVVPFLGKKLFPPVFGRYWIQEAFLVAAVLTSSFGIYFSLKKHFAAERRTRLLVFIVLTAVYFSWIFVSYLRLTHAHSVVANSFGDDSKMFEVIERTRSANSASERRAAAAQWYRAYGTAVAYVGSNSTFEVFEPQAEDITGRKEWLDTWRSYTDTMDFVKQTEDITRLNIGIYTLTFLIGLALASFTSKLKERQIGV